MVYSTTADPQNLPLRPILGCALFRRAYLQMRLCLHFDDWATAEESLRHGCFSQTLSPLPLYRALFA